MTSSGMPLDVLFIAEHFPPRLGGRASWFRELARHQPADRTAFSVPRARGSARVDAALPCSIRRAPTFFGSVGLGGRLWRAHLRWICRRDRPGLIVAGGITHGGAIARELHEELGIPYVVHAEAPELLEARNEIRGQTEGGARLRSILFDSECVVTPNRSSWLEGYKLGLLPQRLEEIPPGADLERFHPGPATRELAAKLDVGKGPIVLCVGGSCPSKDVETILRGFSVLQSQRRSAVLVFMGPGEPQAWRGLLKSLKIERSVRFLRAIPEAEVPDVYRLADLFVLAHREDRDSWIVQGMEIAFLEALASGLPIVATRTAATAEWVSEDEVGLLVEPGAHTKLGKSMGDIVRTKERRDALGARARTEAEERFDARANAARFRELLEVIYYRRLGLGDLRGAVESPDETSTPEGTEHSVA